MSAKNSHHRIRDRVFPFLAWLKGYDLACLRSDAMAGLTVAVVLIPQSMAYAMLAGLPPVYGLYAAATTPLIAALWGSLRQLATGPIAIMSLLVLTTLTPLSEPGSQQFVELALLLAFLIGVIYLTIGLLRMGVVMAFISHSAVKGFTAAAALIIIATQLPHLLGLSVSRHEYIFPMLLEIIKGLPQLHLHTTLVGLAALAVIFGLKRIASKLPAGLIALVITTAAIILLELHLKGIAVIGKIPEGLPYPHAPPLDLDIIASLLGPAFVIALVSFAETYSVGKAISAETKQKVNVDQEFIGQGLANLIGSFFQSYPVSGSFSRTAINFATGAQTGISSVIASLIVILALLFLTPLFTFIPRTALAALVISAVLLLFHPKEVFTLWKKNRDDGIVALVVFGLALLTKPDYALLIGVIISLVFFLWKTMHPRIVRITKDPERNMFLNADTYNKPSCPQILQLRCDNAIYFANAEYTAEQILERLDGFSTPIKFLMLNFEAVGFIDLTGTDALRTLLEELQTRGVSLAFLSVHQPVKQVFDGSGLSPLLNSEHMFARRELAISRLFRQIDHGYCQKVCPYSLFHECATVK